MPKSGMHIMSGASMRRQPVQVGCHKTEFFLKVRFHQPIESVFLFICVEVYLCFKNGENGQDIKEYAYRHVHHGAHSLHRGMDPTEQPYLDTGGASTERSQPVHGQRSRHEGTEG